jgi:hypothetical protein
LIHEIAFTADNTRILPFRSFRQGPSNQKTTLNPDGSIIKERTK